MAGTPSHRNTDLECGKCAVYLLWLELSPESIPLPKVMTWSFPNGASIRHMFQRKKKAAAIEGTNLTQPNEAVEIARTDAG